MDFLEAMKALVEGKKLRRVYWDEDVYIMVDEYRNIVYNDGMPCEIGYLADNWELFQ